MYWLFGFLSIRPSFRTITMRIVQILLIVLIFISCNWTEKANNKRIISERIESETSSQKANYTDKQGLRQGIWTNKKQNGIEIKTYKDGILEGNYSIGNLTWRREGFYRHGKLHGLQRTFSGEKVVTIGSYYKGRKLWFTTYEESIILSKGFSIQDDTVIFVAAPYPSGKKWYEGEFKSVRDYRRTAMVFETIPIGQHKVYFTNGKLKGIVNYDKKLISEYDSLGKQIYNTVFSDVGTHKQTIQTDYYE